MEFLYIVLMVICFYIISGVATGKVLEDKLDDNEAGIVIIGALFWPVTLLIFLGYKLGCLISNWLGK